MIFYQRLFLINFFATISTSFPIKIISFDMMIAMRAFEIFLFNNKCNNEKNKESYY